MSNDDDRSEQAIMNLTMNILSTIRTHYHVRPTQRSTVHEVLNALAGVTGGILSEIPRQKLAFGNLQSEIAYEWFMSALHLNMADPEKLAEGEATRTLIDIKDQAMSLIVKMVAVIDDEIEQRKHGGNDEAWTDLAELSATAHDLIKAAP